MELSTPNILERLVTVVLGENASLTSGADGISLETIELLSCFGNPRSFILGVTSVVCFATFFFFLSGCLNKAAYDSWKSLPSKVAVLAYD